MPVHVDEVLTDVVPEPEPAGAATHGAEPPPPWREADRLRALADAVERDRLRTRAGGFDD